MDAIKTAHKVVEGRIAEHREGGRRLVAPAAQSPNVWAGELGPADGVSGISRVALKPS
jgi:hypothetical protein